MNITDELREYADKAAKRQDYMAGLTFDLERIADRIDAELQKAEDNWKAEKGDAFVKGYAECHAELMDGSKVISADLEKAGYVRLPVDADGVPIRIGDKVTEHEDGHTFKVDGFMDWDGEWWVFMRDGVQAPARNCTHYHEPTVEDVLREIVHKCQPTYSKDGSYTTGLTEEEFAEYAAKLRLANSEE